MMALQKVPGPSPVHHDLARRQARPSASSKIPRIALLTGGGDKPYVLGLTEALTSHGVSMDLIGSNHLQCNELLNNPEVNFLNLRGEQRYDASRSQKTRRILVYYARLIRYATVAQPKIFHILWNNRFELFDRTLIMLFYKALGRRVVLTAHNVNAGARDGCDSYLNQLTLRIQYALSDGIFVHTQAMKEELKSEFGVRDTKISVIPFGINNTIPNTSMTPEEARRRMRIEREGKILLFFGRIVPYKGLEYLIEAFRMLIGKRRDIRLIIAGATHEAKDYWEQIQQVIARTGAKEKIVQHIRFVPDKETEVFFKAADVLILPYTRIFQTGLTFLAYSFGLPVIAADVGSLKEDIIEGETGYICPPKDPAALAEVIEKFFSSDLHTNIEYHRRKIKEYANERYSWSKVAAITTSVYAQFDENAGLRQAASGS